MNEQAAYNTGDLVDIRQDKESPWTEKGTITMGTLPTMGTGSDQVWMVRINGQHGAHPIPAERLRRRPEDSY